MAVGPKNWMFYGSNQGGRTAAVLTTLIATCKRLHIDPFAYLRDLFPRISDYPQNRLAELLPDQWKAAQAVEAAQKKEDSLHGRFPTPAGENLGLGSGASVSAISPTRAPRPATRSAAPSPRVDRFNFEAPPYPAS